MTYLTCLVFLKSPWCALFSNSLNLKNKTTKIEHKKIFCGLSKIFKNISWLINTGLKYFMILTKTPNKNKISSYKLVTALNCFSKIKWHSHQNATSPLFLVPTENFIKSIKYSLDWRMKHETESVHNLCTTTDGHH